MNDVPMLITGTTQQMYAVLLGVCGRSAVIEESAGRTLRDRGAVSLEQVLWFVAAGVSVVVIATILWNQIRDQANTPVDPPVAPTP